MDLRSPRATARADCAAIVEAREGPRRRGCGGGGGGGRGAAADAGGASRGVWTSERRSRSSSRSRRRGRAAAQAEVRPLGATAGRGHARRDRGARAAAAVAAGSRAPRSRRRARGRLSGRSRRSGQRRGSEGGGERGSRAIAGFSRSTTTRTASCRSPRGSCCSASCASDGWRFGRARRDEESGGHVPDSHLAAAPAASYSPTRLSRRARARRGPAVRALARDQRLGARPPRGRRARQRARVVRGNGSTPTRGRAARTAARSRATHDLALAGASVPPSAAARRLPAQVAVDVEIDVGRPAAAASLPAASGRSQTPAATRAATLSLCRPPPGAFVSHDEAPRVEIGESRGVGVGARGGALCRVPLARARARRARSRGSSGVALRTSRTNFSPASRRCVAAGTGHMRR